ncbi:hypothetical protein HS088_TW22G00119 [Tripterygium wilfordii]|uniref:Uncharacterized protein n=1 Tax=Tripterygium wilfordii TaxID=458696 RepID=A0A7J7BX40_TRIWF|nr:hypothetical protein HS088_TW22G00119 [Tripterygium wilfordii]
MRRPLLLECSIWLVKGGLLASHLPLGFFYSLFLLIPFDLRNYVMLMLQVVSDCWEDSWKDSRRNRKVLDFKIFCNPIDHEILIPVISVGHAVLIAQAHSISVAG